MIPGKKNKLLIYNLFIAFILLLASCKQLDTFEKDTNIPKYEWKSSFAATGNFLVSDTTSIYDAYIVIRHTDAYKYNNIWLNLGIQFPGDSMQYQKINVDLASDAEDAGLRPSPRSSSPLPHGERSARSGHMGIGAAFNAGGRRRSNCLSPGRRRSRFQARWRFGVGSGVERSSGDDDGREGGSGG